MMIRRLRHTFNHLPQPNREEEAYVQGWSVIEDEVTRLLDQSLKYQKRGKPVIADRLNETANKLIYLFYYAYFIRNFLDRQGLIDDRCSAIQLEETFNVECVERNLQCLSANEDTDFVSAWNQLLDVFGITRQTEGCETECCLGVGEMEILTDDCIGFIIGPCEENIIPEFVGEYEDCTYDNAHNNAEEPGACNITDKCN